MRSRGDPRRTIGYTLEWLSLLRHYGTPTRLLDLTYSFFIASYFALEETPCVKPGQRPPDSVVWAVNVTKLDAEAERHIAAKRRGGKRLLDDYSLKVDGAPFRKLFMIRSPIRFVYRVTPLRLNERLTIQQGLFLAPGDVSNSFEQNVRAVPNHEKHIIAVIIQSDAREEILEKLFRMGINRATLYPGLEGFAWSLRTKSLILKKLDKQSPKTLEHV